MIPAVDTLKKQITPALQRHGVVRAGVFGSVARGEDRADSDVDLLVEFEQGKTLFDLVELRMEISDLLGREADVVTYGALHPKLRDQILREQIAIL